MKGILLAGYLAATCFGSVLANGGGYFAGGVSETGSILGFSPEGTETVQILDEQLTVALRPTEADVDIRYILKNTGEASTVRFGFPVEELEEQEMDSRKREVKQRTQLAYCRDYSVEIGGKKIPHKFEAESAAAQRNDSNRAGLKGWLISQVRFAPNEEKTLRIRYRSDYPSEFVAVSGSGSVSSKHFSYRLSTGACWAGPIVKGRVVIQPEGVNPSEVTIEKPVNRFKKEGKNWVWNFENLEPTLADDIKVEAIPSAYSESGRTLSGKHAESSDEETVDFVERKGDWFLVHTNYSVKASSTLPPSGTKTYGPGNLRDKNDGVWSEGAPGPGLGEWIEITPEVAQPLRSIKMLPGYVSGGPNAKETYAANARPKKVEVLINGSELVDAALADKPEEQEITLGGYDKPVKRIRLMIKEVYPGSTFEDLCISGIKLESRLKKKPKLEPTR